MVLLWLWLGLAFPAGASRHWPSECMNDVHEPNGTRSRAAPVGAQGVSGRLCEGDADWYVAELGRGRYRLTLDGSPGVRLALFAPRRRRPLLGLRPGARRWLRVRTPGRYRFVVRGDAASGAYRFQWARQ